MLRFLKTLILTLHFLTAPVLSSDRRILLRFKTSVTDPTGILSSWSATSDHCSWSGVYCDAASRVHSLIIPGGNCPNPNPSFTPAAVLLRGRRCDGGGGGLNGSLTAALGSLYFLRILSLPFNRLQGEVPPSIWSLKNLQVLDLEGNPLFFHNPNRLKIFNLRFYSIEVPYSVLPCPPSFKFYLKPLLCFKNSLSISTTASQFSNPLISAALISEIGARRRKLKVARDLLDESPLQESEQGQGEEPYESVSAAPGRGGGLSSIGLASLISGSAIGSVLLALLMLFLYTRKWAPASKVQVMELREITMFSNPGVAQLKFETVVQATAHFSAGKCIGSGGFGATYKAEVSPGVLVAVKRVSVGRFVQGVQQFHAEIKTLGRIRHPNLVTLIGYHASDSEMFLVYNYLPGGNLERFIHERRDGGPVEWTVVHRVASQIAAALAYLHDECVPRVLHRDVKPSNILLDAHLNAYLSDFGLSRLMGATETHATTGVAGTFGYVAPEYAMTCRVSEKSDVYSYGVVLLELISDKKALDPSFSDHGNGFNIVSWACLLLRQGRADQVFARRLWEDGPRTRLVALLHLAVMCTVESLSIRPTMKQVVHRLRQLHSPPG